MAPCFVSTPVVLGKPVATTSFTCRTRPSRSPRTARPAAVRMGLGEDGLADDLSFAQQCIEEGCEVDAVQDVLTRLEQRRAILSLELGQINEIMSVLARENLGGDRNLVEQAMEAAVSIFSKTDDDYPSTGMPSPWTLDKPKRKQSKM